MQSQNVGVWTSQKNLCVFSKYFSKRFARKIKSDAFKGTSFTSIRSTISNDELGFYRLKLGIGLSAINNELLSYEINCSSCDFPFKSN